MCLRMSIANRCVCGGGLVTALTLGKLSNLIHLDFLRPNSPINIKTRMRGNFLKKHISILPCHGFKNGWFCFPSFWRENRSQKIRMLSFNILILRCFYSPRVVPSDWVTSPWKWHIQYFFKTLSPKTPSPDCQQTERNLSHPKDFIHIHLGQGQAGEIRTRGVIQKEHKCLAVGDLEPH